MRVEGARRTSAQPRRMRLRGAIAALLSTIACAEPRPRLDVPVIRLQLDADTIDVGQPLRGSVTATDASGVVYVSVEACSDTLRKRRPPVNISPADSVTVFFDLDIALAVAAGRTIEVRAIVIDDQSFVVEVADTVFVRGSAVRGPGPNCRPRNSAQ